MIVGSASTGGPVTTNITSCTFNQTVSPTLLWEIHDLSQSANIWNISNCSINNQKLFIAIFSSPSVNITSCYFTNVDLINILLYDNITTSTVPPMTVTVKDCAFDVGYSRGYGAGGGLNIVIEAYTNPVPAYPTHIIPRSRSITAISRMAAMMYAGTRPSITPCVLTLP